MHRDLHRHHQFFCNKEMNEIYISVFLMNLAESMIGIFVPIYLYSLHYSIVSILLFFFIGHVGNVVFSLPIARIVSKIGAKHAILISTPFIIAYYFGLQILPHHSLLFFILPLGITFRSLFYNFGFDLNFIDHLDKKSIGRELSLLGILSIIATVLSPLVAGLVIAYYGYGLIFILGGIILTVSCLPLFVSRDGHPAVNFSGKNIISLLSARQHASMVLSFTGYAIESSIGRNIWPIFLIIIFAATEKVGYVVAASAFITVVVIALAGQLTDRYNPKKLLRFGTMLYFFAWLGCLFADTATKVFFINSYKSVSERFLHLPWASMFYKIVNRDSYFRLVVARDMVYNASRVLVLPFIMLIFAIDFYPFIISFGVAAIFTLLYSLMDFKEDKLQPGI